MNKKNKSKKMHDLRIKVSETKKIEKLKHDDILNHKRKISLLKKANRSPKGERIIKNQPGDIIELKNVSKTYVTGKVVHQILKNASFTIKKGEFVVILGPSGSGKTTLLNVLSGLDRATVGDVIIDNINISSLSSSEMTTFRRNKIGFIFQSYNLLLELNAIENAAMGQQLQIENNRRIDLYELFAKVGLAGKEKSLISELSGGELQRVSIIRALSKNPQVICADEPTGALDSKSSTKIIQLFKEINKQFKTTIILVTHSEANIAHANRVIRVSDGVINVQVK